MGHPTTPPQQNGRFELPVTTTFQSYKPFLHAGSWLESTLVQNNKIKKSLVLSASVALEYWAQRVDLNTKSLRYLIIYSAVSDVKAYRSLQTVAPLKVDKYKAQL